LESLNQLLLSIVHLLLKQRDELVDQPRRKLRIDPQKLRKQEEAGKYQNKLVREAELERYLNIGWEMVQTVNSKILIKKKV
jgi:hypothetical protein